MNTRPDFLPGADLSQVEHPQDFEPGYTEYQIRQSIRDLKRQVGFEQTRQFVAQVLDDESGRRLS